MKNIFRNPLFWGPLAGLIFLSLYSGSYWAKGFPNPESILIEDSPWTGQEVAFLYCRYAGETVDGILLEHPEGPLAIRGSLPRLEAGTRVSVTLFVDPGGTLVLRRWQIHSNRSAKAWLSLLGLLGSIVYILKSLKWSRKGEGLCLT